MDNFETIDWSKVKIISFDLDDTLWDNSGVIEKCLAELYQFLSEHEPKIKKHFTIDSMERISEQLIQLQKPEYENMTVLRKAVIRQMLTEVNGDLSLINPAFAVFYYWRNQIQVPEVSHQVLSHLKNNFILVATSNGNSNLSNVKLTSYFDKHLIAGIHGRAKPSPEMLNRLLEHYEITSEEMLHIGDSHETDIMSAQNSKCLSLQLHIQDIHELLKVPLN